MRGDLTLDLDRTATQRALADFHTARRIAVHQRAKAWELRTATSLGRLLQREGRVDSARAALAPIYQSFREGHTTQDLRDAKSVLDELE